MSLPPCWNGARPSESAVCGAKSSSTTLSAFSATAGSRIWISGSAEVAQRDQSGAEIGISEHLGGWSIKLTSQWSGRGASPYPHDCLRAMVGRMDVAWFHRHH